MNTFLRTLIASVAAVFGFGLAFAGLSAAATTANDDVGKRNEDTSEIVLVDDDDDGDDNSRDGSGVSRDATNSRFSAVSRNRDASRGDLTRDNTRDGGALKRDWSDNRTNDRSRNDSRASRNTGDNTRSNYSGVSRDRDRSVADVTRDFTRDGGDRTRDFSRNLTNDRSRNDTR
jgi:hypothetical protein